MINHWRTVRATDDGCSIYQCLACKQTWEGRDCPGYYDQFIDTPVKVEGGWTTQSTQCGGETTESHYAKRAEPVYMANWLYCPCCGTRWDGPVRCDIDNPYMYGDRRKLDYNARNWHRVAPSYWFIITCQKAIHSKVNPNERTLMEVWEHVKRMQANEARNSYLFDDECPATYKVTIMKNEDIKGRGYIQSECIR